MANIDIEQHRRETLSGIHHRLKTISRQEVRNNSLPPELRVEREKLRARQEALRAILVFRAKLQQIIDLKNAGVIGGEEFRKREEQIIIEYAMSQHNDTCWSDV